MLDDGMCELCEGQVKTDAMLRCSSECAAMPGRLRKLSTDFSYYAHMPRQIKTCANLHEFEYLMCNVYAIMFVQ